MAKASAIPSLSELEQLLRSGMSPKEASDHYRERGLEISPGYISVVRHRQGWPKQRMEHADLIPWKVALEHRALWDHKMLRLESTRRQGGEIPEYMVASLDRWLDRLKDEGLVVHYDSRTEQGWWHVPARDGIDTDLIRVPSPEDEDEGMELR